MICPKCGFEQDERIDCLKCGVVFAKYFALHPEGRPVRAESMDAAASTVSAHRQHEEARPPEQSFVGHPAPERKAQEPERASSEPASLDQRIYASLKVFGKRLGDLQRRVEEPPKFDSMAEELGALRNETQQEIEALRQVVRSQDPKRLLAQLNSLQSRLEALPRELAGQIEASVSERVRGMEARFSELEQAFKSAAAEPSQKEDSGTIAELGRVLKELDGLRASLENVTVRYSEIGELKKNYLSFSDVLESLHREIAAGKEGAYAESMKKMAELEREVTTLRAEMRQILQQTEGSAGPGLAAAGEIQDLKDRVQTLTESRSLQDERLGGIEEQLASRTVEPRTDPKVLVKIQEMEARFAELEKKSESPPDQPGKRKMPDPLLELGKVLKDVDGLRSSLQAVTVRYSEIAELKKNDLTLSNAIESQQRELSALKDSVSGSALKKLNEAQMENEALRTEYRHLVKRVEEGDSATSARLGRLEEKQAARDAGPAFQTDPRILSEIQRIDARFSELQGEVVSQGEQTARETAALKTGLDKSLADLENLHNSLHGVTLRYSEIGELKKNHQLLAEALGDLRSHAESVEARLTALLAQPPPEPLPPLEADVHAIRENLDQIRRFMSSLAQKL